MTETSTLFEVDGRPIQGVTVHGKLAISSWQRLRKEASLTGLWPCILGPPDELSFLEETLGFASGPVEVLLEEGAYFYNTLNLRDRRRTDAVSSGPGPAIARWMCAHPDGGTQESFEAALAADRELVRVEDVDLSRFEWKGHADGGDAFHFTIPSDILTKKPFPEVQIALIPTANNWEVPAYLKFGNWNACPPPEEHVGRMRRWSERFGAEVVGITHDVVELMVMQPPTERDVCLRLALEQYDYCSDIVDQGVGSIEDLAATLCGAMSWYFWWD